MAGYYGASKDQWAKFAEMANAGQFNPPGGGRNVPPPTAADLPRNQQTNPQVATDWGSPNANADALSPMTGTGQNWLRSGYAHVNPQQMQNRANNIAGRYYSTGENPGAQPGGWRQYLGSYMPNPEQSMGSEWQGYQPWWERQGADRTPDSGRYPTDPAQHYWQNHPGSTIGGVPQGPTPGLESAQGMPTGARPALAGPLGLGAINQAGPGMGMGGYASGGMADGFGSPMAGIMAAMQQGGSPFQQGTSPMMPGAGGYGAGNMASGFGSPMAGLIAQLQGGMSQGNGMAGGAFPGGFGGNPMAMLAGLFGGGMRGPSSPSSNVDLGSMGQSVNQAQTPSGGQAGPQQAPHNAAIQGGAADNAYTRSRMANPLTADEEFQKYGRQLQNRGQNYEAMQGAMDLSSRGGGKWNAQMAPGAAARFSPQDLASMQGFMGKYNQQWGGPAAGALRQDNQLPGLPTMGKQMPGPQDRRYFDLMKRMGSDSSTWNPQQEARLGRREAGYYRRHPELGALTD